MGELQKVCKPQRLPDLSYLNTTEQQAILKALTTVIAVLVKLQDHKHLAASQVSQSACLAPALQLTSMACLCFCCDSPLHLAAPATADAQCTHGLQENLEKEEASTMPAAALADPLRWLQAQLQGGERFLGRVSSPVILQHPLT